MFFSFWRESRVVEVGIEDSSDEISLSKERNWVSKSVKADKEASLRTENLRRD